MRIMGKKIHARTYVVCLIFGRTFAKMRSYFLMSSQEFFQPFEVGIRYDLKIRDVMSDAWTLVQDLIQYFIHG